MKPKAIEIIRRKDSARINIDPAQKRNPIKVVRECKEDYLAMIRHLEGLSSQQEQALREIINDEYRWFGGWLHVGMIHFTKGEKTNCTAGLQEYRMTSGCCWNIWFKEPVTIAFINLMKMAQLNQYNMNYLY